MVNVTTFLFTAKPNIDMDYVMIERHLFDALVRGVRECCSALDTALSLVGCHRNGWVDNNSTQVFYTLNAIE